MVHGKCTATFTGLVRLGGGTIGSTWASLEKWHKVYYDNFQYFLRTGQFLGKDQDIMAKTCLETDLCLLVSTNTMAWFMLQVDYPVKLTKILFYYSFPYLGLVDREPAQC